MSSDDTSVDAAALRSAARILSSRADDLNLTMQSPYITDMAYDAIARRKRTFDDYAFQLTQCANALDEIHYGSNSVSTTIAAPAITGGF